MRIIGYILVVVGLVVSLIAKVPALATKLAPILKISTTTISSYGLYAGVIILVAGIVVILKTSGSRGKEVPIYQGDKIVGYRRA